MRMRLMRTPPTSQAALSQSTCLMPRHTSILGPTNPEAMFVTSFSVSSRHNERPSQPFVVLFEARFWRHPAVLEQSVAPVRRLHERSSRQFCVRPQRSERLSVSLFGGLVPRRSPGALPVAESRLDHPRRALHETSPKSPTWRLRPCSSAPQARRPCILELRPFWICSRFSLNSCLLIRMPGIF